MRKISTLFILFFAFAFLSIAGTNEDSKYLKGAVPEVDGKVVFERQLNINQSIPSKQLFDLVKSWADTAFAYTPDSNQRILLTDDAEQFIAAHVEQVLVFKTSFISVDRTTLQYRLILKVEQGKVLMTFSNIRYEYQDFTTLEKAENLIVDKYAYNEKKNSLNRYYDKFRIFTIDAVDNKMDELKKYLSNVSLNKLDKDNATSLQQRQQQQSVIQETKNTVSIVSEEAPSNTFATVSTNVTTSTGNNSSVATPTTSAVDAVTPMVKLVAVSSSQTKFEGYKLVTDADVISNYQSMIAQSKLLLLTTSGETILASWNGLNEMNGNDVSMVTINKENTSIVNDNYTVSFINNSIYKDELSRIEHGDDKSLSQKDNAYSEGWMIIVCKKMMTIPATSNEDISMGWEKLNKANKVILMGEIEQIWVR